jgi:hypothetical protein
MRKIEEDIAGPAGVGKSGSAPPLRLLTISYAKLRFAAIWLVGVLRVMSGYGMAACGAKRPFIRKQHPVTDKE